jgi:hypothetical protein
LEGNFWKETFGGKGTANSVLEGNLNHIHVGQQLTNTIPLLFLEGNSNFGGTSLSISYMYIPREHKDKVTFQAKKR